MKNKENSLSMTKPASNPWNYFDRMIDQVFPVRTHNYFTDYGMENKINDDGSLSVAIDLPGIKEKDIAIELRDNVVSIRGERKTATSSYVVQKSFTIDDGFSGDGVQAHLTDGILTLTLPSKMSESAPDVKKIEITQNPQLEKE